MNINLNDDRWLNFNSEPNSGSYKGYEIKGTIKTKPTGQTKLTFTNGESTFNVIGESPEEAFLKAFDKIDKLTS